MADQSKWERLPTEAINPDTAHIDTLRLPDIVELMIDDNRRVLDAVRHEKDRITQVGEIFEAALRNRGRLIFVGAGTSGRLGVLEAAEMPPTFGIGNDVVHAVMAGGHAAPRRAEKRGGGGEEKGGGAGGEKGASRGGRGIRGSARGGAPF